MNFICIFNRKKGLKCAQNYLFAHVVSFGFVFSCENDESFAMVFIAVIRFIFGLLLGMRLRIDVTLLISQLCARIK